MALLRATLHYCIHYTISFTLIFICFSEFHVSSFSDESGKVRKKILKLESDLARVPSMLDFVPIIH